jgi:hypothetical protein
MHLRHPLTLLRLALLVSIPVALLVLFRLLRAPYEAGYLFQTPHWLVVLGLGTAGLAALAGLLLLSLSPYQELIPRGLNAGLGLLKRLGKLNLVLFALLIALFSTLVLGRYGYLLDTIPMRLFFFAGVVLAGLVFLRAAGIGAGVGEALVISTLAVLFGYRLAAYLPEISTYPFTLNWSEASRFYYASLYFSESLYDLRVPPTVLHPSRYLLQALPFLIPGSPLWLHRLWQVMLWIGVTLAGSWALARRFDHTSMLRRWMFIAWAFLFLLIGPVYYHLVVPFFLVLWGFQPRTRPVLSVAVVLLASLWAGISRINWYPVPAMLAAALYLMETPLGSKPLWKYLLYPLALGIAGTAAAFGAQALYVLWSGNPPEQFTSSLTSDLLWQRLLPNPTYPLGVLPAVLLVSAPILWMAVEKLAGRWRLYHPVRLLGLAAMLLVLFAGGLVVSTKIGGGSNLHNMDAYLALLLVIGAYIFFDHFVPDGPAERPMPETSPVVLSAILGMTALFTLMSGSSLHLPTEEKTRQALATLRDYVAKAVEDGGEVLFISERQLLTFDYLEGAALVPDYEKVFLMEMAMAANPDYLGRFNADLRDRRFKLIVSEPLFNRIKDSTYIFGEENNAWVRNVSRPVLCYYKPVRFALPDLPIQVLLPRDRSDCAP